MEKTTRKILLSKMFQIPYTPSPQKNRNLCEEVKKRKFGNKRKKWIFSVLLVNLLQVSDYDNGHSISVKCVLGRIRQEFSFFSFFFIKNKSDYRKTQTNKLHTTNIYLFCCVSAKFFILNWIKRQIYKQRWLRWWHCVFI